MATRKTAASATPATQTELEQYRALKAKLEQEGNQKAAELIANIKRDLRELVELRDEFDIYVDFEELVSDARGTGLYWNSSSMDC